MCRRDDAQKGNDHEYRDHNDERISQSIETESEGNQESENHETSEQSGEGRESETFKQTEGPKKDRVLELLRRKEGATIAEIAKATGWQNHTIRGFISGTISKKMGLTVLSSKNESGERIYRIGE